MTTPQPPASEAIAAAIARGEQTDGAWALIRRSTRAGDLDTIGILAGHRWVAESLLDVPLEQGVPGRTANGELRRADRLVAVPFRQVRERGFEAHDDGTPLVVVDVETELEYSVSDVVDAIEDEPVDFHDRGGFGTDDASYEKVVQSIIEDEIGQGEGANLVIGRTYRAVAADWSAEKALSVYRRLLTNERGAYWTFLFFTGDRYLIGATPERHVSVSGGEVRMNPISGTFRLPPSIDPVTLKPDLIKFLHDEKEIYELYMVVDEELKMMCDLCSEGGQVLGPFLKPMSRLIHTEYLLAGHSHRDPREILRDTMYAATVTGSPVENACRLIKRYETEGRGYYGAALAVIGRDETGAPVLDSPIVIRTADVSLDGVVKVSAGATLVRDSVPAHEVAETHAKAGGILAAFGLVPAAAAPTGSSAGTFVSELIADEDVLVALNARNRRLSRFWFTDQGAEPDESSVVADFPGLVGKHVVILDGEDDFVKMLRHVLASLGMTSSVVRHEDYRTGTSFAGADLVIVGPGPGDPRDGDDPKMAQLRAAVDEVLATRTPFLSVCLGHQALCHQLGLELNYKDIVFQGTQSPVRLPELTGRNRVERVGFYNTFVARVGSSILPDDVTVDADPDSGDVHAIVGPHYRGIQFHAESILTEHGDELLASVIADLLLA